MAHTPNPHNLHEGAEITPEILASIMGGLADVGLFGEVRLIVKNGHIRFVRTVRTTAVHSSKNVQGKDTFSPLSDP